MARSKRMAERDYNPVADGQGRAKAKTKRLNIEIPLDVHEQLRRQAFEENTTITKIVLEALAERS